MTEDTVQCTRCGKMIRDDGFHLCPLASSDSEAKREAAPEGRARGPVQPLDGLHASEASVSGAEIRPGGDGQSPTAAAPDEAHAGPDSQPANGLPRRGDGASELFQRAHILDERLRMMTDDEKWQLACAVGQMLRALNASVKPID